MADVSDEAIKKYLSKVLLDRDPTNWLSISYAEGSNDKLVLSGFGSGGLREFAESMKPSFSGYGFVRVLFGSEKQAKFVVIQFVGEKCTSLKKARVIVHEEDVLLVLKPCDAFISASCKNELSERKVVDAIAKPAER